MGVRHGAARRAGVIFARGLRGVARLGEWVRREVVDFGGRWSRCMSKRRVAKRRVAKRLGGVAFAGQWRIY